METRSLSLFKMKAKLKIWKPGPLSILRIKVKPKNGDQVPVPSENGGQAQNKEQAACAACTFSGTATD